MSQKLRILVDCDGVLADFTSAALKLIKKRTGDHYHNSDVKQWDIFKAVDKKNLEHILQDAVEHDGFCLKLNPLEGAKNLIESLNKNYEVFIVTSPFLARNWAYERTRWLESHFGILPKQVVHTKSKHVVYGNVLIDDSGKNLKAWAQAWPNGLPILFDAPYNQDDKEFPRANTWQEVINLIERKFQNEI